MLTEKQAIEKIREDVADAMTKNEIFERYWKRRVSSGDKAFQTQLGNVQRDMKEQKTFLAFLDEIAKE